MTQSWKSWNWKLWLLGLLVACGVIATSGDYTLAQNSITVQSLTDSGSTVQAASLLIDTRDQFLFEKQFSKLDFTSLNLQSTANNPSLDQIYLQINGQIATPESTMNPGVKAGDTVQLNSGCLFYSSVTLEINRLTNDGKNEKIPKTVNSCNLFPSSSSLEFISKNTSAHYILNYNCSKVNN
ncbi:hypothetical protein [Brasilonema sp. UFV-L1]|uniref:hypothetical protein n=1 Tax=Brasilonema sp. UFV-L1 TaxID=2234130 RepID=UPI00145F8877|nr:hypothetical protein [Brasilonema sp. UFV-L1]NMG09201.1 hypothetical protein [Brasilonema sp. UFV-L1]